MASRAPILYWVRRDFRLRDNAALSAAAASGAPVIPVFLRDEVAEGLGRAPRWRLGLAAERFGRTLEAMGSGLVLRRGDALPTLRALCEETGARTVLWSRAYDPQSVARDTAVKAGLAEAEIEGRSHTGHLLVEPWTVKTKAGGFFKVYTPFWRAVRAREMPGRAAAPGRIPAPEHWPSSLPPEALEMGAGMGRGADVVRPWLAIGEEAAQARLDRFLEGAIAGYSEGRNLVAEAGTSRLSENLALGEIAPARVWAAATAAREAGAPGAEDYLKELGWREFAYHLLWHTPQIATRNWREGWDDFPWNEDEGRPEVRAWQRGRTGMRFVDAAMRELYVTGTMHNRARMIVASYLTKHLLTHWRIGQEWFADCLVDWDPASNAMGWQWSAGSGPDATPYFRVFNPETQLEKFDPEGAYARRWIAEGQAHPPATALSYFEAIPPGWGLSPGDPYPAPVVGAAEGRARALAAYGARNA